MEGYIDWLELLPHFSTPDINDTFSNVGHIIRDVVDILQTISRNTFAVFLSLIICVVSAIWGYNSNRKKYTHSMLPQIVLEVNPGVCTTKWDQIACKMNEQCSISLFSDGEECQKFFTEHFSQYSSEPVDSAPFDATKRYSEAVSELYENSLQDDFPSNPKYLPVNEQYGGYKWLIFGLPILKKPGLILSLLTLGKTLRSVLGQMSHRKKVEFGSFDLLQCYFAISNVSKTYKSHFNAKYDAIGDTQCVKFLASVTHFAPGYDLQKWDHIASNMNWYMIRTGSWTESYEKFLDGKECSDFYRSQLMPLANPTNSEDLYLKEIVSKVNKVCAPS